jgi:hypothetical protein
MQNYQAELNKLIVSYPIHIHPESPPGFDKVGATNAARKCVDEIKKETSLGFLESPPEVAQDASFFAEFKFNRGDGSDATMLFSAFGGLVTIVNEKHVTANELMAIKNILEGGGFVYLSEEIRVSPKIDSSDSCKTWGDRFFSYL